MTSCGMCNRTTVEACDDIGCGYLGSGNGAPQDDYKLWYDEAIEASNECGFACMSAADVIRYQDAEIQRLREYEFMYKELCN